MEESLDRLLRQQVTYSDDIRSYLRSGPPESGVSAPRGEEGEECSRVPGGEGREEARPTQYQDTAVGELRSPPHTTAARRPQDSKILGECQMVIS